MPEFVPVLIVATLFLVLLMALVVIIEQPIGIPQFIRYFEPFAPKGFTSRTILLDQDITLKSKTEVITEFSASVSRSLLEKKDFSLPIQLSKQHSRTTIEFYVNDTNHLGSLIFEIDGKELYRRVTERGDYNFEFDSTLLKNGSVLRISVAPPPLLFWETNYYTLIGKVKGLEIWEGYYSFTTNKTSDYELVGDIEEKWGWVSVYLNGKEIYSGSPEGNLIVQLPRNKLKIKNTLKITPTEGSYYKFSALYIYEKK